MGYVKTLMLEQQEQGWEYSDYRICSRCLCDEHLRTKIQEQSSAEPCSFCMKSDHGSAPFDDLMGLLSSTAGQYFNRAVDRLPWDGEDQMYLGETLDTSEMILERLDPFSERDNVLDAVVRLFDDDEWCRTDVYHLEGVELYAVSWKRFCDTVRHRVRFFFGREHRDDWMSETIPVHKMMGTLGHIIVQTAGLVSILTQGTKVFRIRKHLAAHVPDTWRELGPPPDRVAPSNRMSPAGIAMFYAALEQETALAEMEVGSLSDEDRLTGATWRNTRDIRILDLTAIPGSVPSMFSLPRSQRDALLFLHKFVKDVRMPVEHDGREHIDYVPTQIVTEFFRHGTTSDDLQGLEGIVYPSAAAPGGRAAAIFVSQRELDPDRRAESGGPILSLDPESIVRIEQST